MPTNDGLKQASVRAVTGTTLTYEGDWNALFDLGAIPRGSFDERLLQWVNVKLSTAFASLPAAEQALATANSVYNWSSLGTFDASTTPAAPVNITPPVITGIATENQTLTCSTGTWSGSPAPTFSYQWKRGVTNVGTNANTYVLVTADVGQSITCVVTATNGSGAVPQASNAVVPVAAPAITGTPGTTGTSGAAYSFAPSKSGGHGSGVWTLSGTLGASNLSFNTSTGVLDTLSLGPAAVYGPYSEYWTDSDGIQSNTIGPWSITVTGGGGGVPVNSVAPAITGMNTSGTADPGQVLTVSTGTWSNSPTGYNYQWKLAGSNVGTNANTYTPTDVGPAALAITCEVTAFNGSGNGSPATSNSVNTFNPRQITNITSMFDAEDTSKITMSGGVVSTWTSSTPDAIALTQGSGSFRPVYSATSFNGRPGVTADGVDDYLRAAGTFSPSGATAEEVWAVATQDLATASGSFRFLFAQGTGDPTGAGSRQLLRNVVSSQSRAAGQIGTTGIVGPTSVVWVGAHVARMMVGATSTQIDLDNQAGTPNTLVPVTGNTSLSMFCAQNSTPGAFWSGTASTIMRFSSLTSGEIQSLYRWTGARAGLSLP